MRTASSPTSTARATPSSRCAACLAPVPCCIRLPAAPCCAHARACGVERAARPPGALLRARGRCRVATRVRARDAAGRHGARRLAPHQGPGGEGHRLDRGPGQKVRPARPRRRGLPVRPKVELHAQGAFPAALCAAPAVRASRGQAAAMTACGKKRLDSAERGVVELATVACRTRSVSHQQQHLHWHPIGCRQDVVAACGVSV